MKKETAIFAAMLGVGATMSLANEYNVNGQDQFMFEGSETRISPVFLHARPPLDENRYYGGGIQVWSALGLTLQEQAK
ncbi:hypothetical protein [Sulfitobacter donghicola]|uniref:Uncharacterized protein n=1 Tax=Sulfitobacter donghicola DSW-25 = KCTC 12864 = JCM 14565 TaxID=1300350 RepID=A0A073IL68_9RHOB|nr:hypothetical protein [Sulfitobacter donghicola]KEJ91038.1 hypothetical protein DSW25_00170 [Sulfitobacter donghicola DSW-25 = KCTC 12864 = JCM 14565]KIN67598.1 hypothetical protein Z948_1320 [Sulfitobacter donghicola DSW-25 = KCTC 12864 = JCM 14565]